MKKEKIPKIYSEYLLSNILLTVLIVGLLAGVVMPGLSKKDRQEQLRQAQAALEGQKDWLDERILDSEKLLYTLMQDPEFVEICRKEPPYSTQALDNIRTFVNDFARYRILQDNLESITVYLGKSELFLDTGSAGVVPELFYNSHFDREQQSYQEWREEVLLGEPRITLREHTRKGTAGSRYLLYNLSTQSLFDNPLVLVTAFAENPYIRILKDSQFFQDSELLLFGNEGRVLFSTLGDTDEAVNLSKKQTGEKVKLGNSGYTAVREAAELASVEYVWLIPDQVIYQNTGRDVITVLLTGFLMTLGFILMAIYLAYRSSKPIYEFVRRIADKSGDPDSDLFLDTGNVNSSLEKVVNKNILLKDELQRYVHSSKIIFFTKLLNGVPMSQLEITSVNRHLGQFLYYRKYCTALVHLDLEDTKSSDIFRMMVEDTIRHNSPHYCYVVQTEINRFAIIFASDTEDEQSIGQGLDRMMEALDRDGTAQYTCILSGYCEVPEQVCSLYQGCCQVFDMLEKQGTAFAERLVHAAGMEEAGRGYYYPLFEEQGLMNCMAGNKYEEAAVVVRRLFARNLKTGTVSAKELQFFVENLCCTFLRALRSGESYGKVTEQYVENSIYQIRQMRRGDSILNQFLEILLFLEKNTKTDSPNKAQQICSRMEKMIGDRYREPEFSIVEIARSLHLSENYISVIFRQNSGASIAATIEKVRMEKAGELVRNTDTFIKEIARQTGYLNLNTFYKAFKRYYGVTPSDYREMAAPKV